MKFLITPLKFILSGIFLTSLAACGGSSDEPELSGENPEPKLAASFPEDVERGQRFLISIEDSGDFNLDVDESIYVEESGERQWEIVAPSGIDAAEFIAIDVFEGDSKVTSLQVAVNAPSPKQLEGPTRPYPFITSWLPSYEGGPSDENGVPLFEYGTETDYFPIQISKVTQSLYNVIYQEQATQTQQELFIAMSNWLRDNCVYTKWGFCSWQTQLDVAAYQLPDNWTSAMAQGQGISALISAYALTGDNSYLQVAY
ncbi:MAG TPA: hypothetical protein DCF92_03585, partial [Idiomarina sp.]|nr:hypothetical protein [Idiomarina sp.]